MIITESQVAMITRQKLFVAQAKCIPGKPASLLPFLLAAASASLITGCVIYRYPPAPPIVMAQSPVGTTAARQLHLRWVADAELGVRAVRLRRRGGAGAGGRSIAGADGARRRLAQPPANRRRRRRVGAGRAGRALARPCAGFWPRARRLRDRRQAVYRAICAGRADRAAAGRQRPVGAASRRARLRRHLQRAGGIRRS